MINTVAAVSCSLRGVIIAEMYKIREECGGYKDVLSLNHGCRDDLLFPLCFSFTGKIMLHVTSHKTCTKTYWVAIPLKLTCAAFQITKLALYDIHACLFCHLCCHLCVEGTINRMCMLSTFMLNVILDLWLWLWVFCPLKDVSERQLPHYSMQKRLRSATPGFDAQSREKKGAQHQHLPLKSAKFPLIPAKSSGKQLSPHLQYKLTHTGMRQKILICFRLSESWRILKNHHSHTRAQRGTQLNICRWASMFEGWSEHQTAQSQINNNFHKYLEHNSKSLTNHPEYISQTIKSLLNFPYQQFKQPPIQTCVDRPSLIVSLLVLFLFPSSIDSYFLSFLSLFCLPSSVLSPTAACCFLYFFLINNIIPIFRPLVASPSVTCVRQEESNYWILALRSARLHKSPSCFPVFSSSVAFSSSYLRSTMWTIMLKPKISIGCQTTKATHLEEFCEKWRLGLLFCRGDARFINPSLSTAAGTLYSSFSWEVLCLLQIFITSLQMLHFYQPD